MWSCRCARSTVVPASNEQGAAGGTGRNCQSLALPLPFADLPETNGLETLVLPTRPNRPRRSKYETHASVYDAPIERRPSVHRPTAIGPLAQPEQRVRF